VRFTRTLGALTGAATLAVAVLGIAASASAEKPATAGTPTPLGRIALVPLDDRPVNLLAPAATAALAGMRVDTPPREQLGRFTTPGDTAAVGQWLTSQNDADAYVVSTSMLAYGGLVASRGPDLSQAQAEANIQPIKAVHAAHPDTPLYVFDTIQRLALTSLTVDGTDYASAVRNWAILYDQVVNLGMTQYQAQLDAVRAAIPDEVINDYLAARGRNHAVNEQMIRWVADGTIDDLVLGEDDTAQYGLERAERVQLEQLVAQLGVGDRVQIFPGADEIDALLVARVAIERLHVAPSVAVEYAGVDGSQWTAALEDIPFADNITRHLAALGLRTDATSDVHLLVNTPSATGANRGADLDRFVGHAGDLLASGANVIVDDPVIVNKADHDLVTRMQDRLALPELLGYSGWNTGGNSLGLALAEGLTRYAFLQATEREDNGGITRPTQLAAANAHVAYLLKRFVIDDRWKNDVQPAAIAYGTSQGWNTNSLTDAQYGPMNQWVVDHLTPVTQDYFARYFAGRAVLAGHLGSKPLTATIGSLDSVAIQLPWPRLFETELKVSTSLR
jgi:Protein of unknown function (DUF4127)